MEPPSAAETTPASAMPLPSTSLPKANGSPLKLYVHVVSSTADYCDYVAGKHAKHVEKATRADGHDAGRMRGGREEGEDTEEEKENKGQAKLTLQASTLLEYGPTSHGKILMLYDGGTQTIKDLKEDVLERYRKTFSKARKVAYIDYVFDHELFALADDFCLRDCFRSGDHVVVVGARTRIVRRRRSLIDDKASASRTILNKKHTVEQLPKELDIVGEGDEIEREVEEAESLDEEVTDEADKGVTREVQESEGVPVLPSLQDGDISSAIPTEMVQMQTRIEDGSHPFKRKPDTAGTTIGAKARGRKKTKTASVVEEELPTTDTYAPVLVAEGLPILPSAGSSLVAKRSGRKTRGARKLSLT